MSISNSLDHCFYCDEQYDIYQCKGCSKAFCFLHLLNHREENQQNFNQLQNNCNIFRENLNDAKINFPLIKNINQWEFESINKIKQMANKCREKILYYLMELDKNLNDLFEQSKQISKQNKFNEIILEQLNEKLDKLIKEFNEPSNIIIKENQTSFINYFNIIMPFAKVNKWKQHANVVAGGNSAGKQLNQLFFPHKIIINDQQTIYIADCFNHRIVEWKLNSQQGRIVAGGNDRGNRTNQLDYPTNVLVDTENNSLIIADSGNSRVMRWSLENNTTHGQVIIEDLVCLGLAMDKDGSLYVSDYKKNQVKRWKKGEKEGTIVAGGNGQGDQLNQFNDPTFIFVDDNYSLYVSEKSNHRITKWMKYSNEGVIVAGGNGKGSSLRQLSSPHGIIVDHSGKIYVADSWNHRVMCWCEGDDEGRTVVGGIDRGNQANQLSFPEDLSFDIEGNLYVADYFNNRILKFEIDLN